MKIREETLELMILESSPLKQIVIGITIIFIGASVFLTSGSGVWVFGSLFCIVGALVLVFASKTRVTFNKQIRNIEIEQKSLIRRKFEEHDFDSLEGVQVKRVHLRSRRRKGAQSGTLKLVLVLKSGDSVTVDSHRGSGDLVGFFTSQIAERNMKITGQKMANFIGIPFYDNPQISMKQVQSAVEEIFN